MACSLTRKEIFEIVLYIWEGTPWRRLFLYS
jgi:hypothetical protein